MPLTTADLMALPVYERYRRQHQRRLIRHRRERSVPLGPHMRVHFEDETTLLYQIQEVLRAERSDDLGAMQHEVDTCAHLVPDGTTWNATLLIELPEAAQRQRLLPLLNRAAHELYIEVAHQPRAMGQANEDLHDRHLTRPSAVHFLRFRFGAAQRAAVHAGAPVTLGCAHHGSWWRHVLPPATLARLRHDLLVPGGSALAAPDHRPPRTATRSPR